MLAADAVITVHNPGTGERLGEVAATTGDGLNKAVERAQHGQRAMAAHAGTRAGRPAATPSPTGIEAEQESLAHLLAPENGKPITQTRGEVAAAIRIFRGLRGRGDPDLRPADPARRRTRPGTAPRRDHPRAARRRRGAGPVQLPGRAVRAQGRRRARRRQRGDRPAARALPARPASGSPRSSSRQARPEHAHQLVTGGAEVSQALAELPRASPRSRLTGSTAAGREIARAGQRHAEEGPARARRQRRADRLRRRRRRRGRRGGRAGPARPRQRPDLLRGQTGLRAGRACTTSSSTPCSPRPPSSPSATSSTSAPTSAR